MPVYEMTSDNDDELGLMELEPKPNWKFTGHKTWNWIKSSRSAHLIVIENSVWIFITVIVA